MQQHYEVINLHNIIRTQQAKIHELRQQLRIANQRQQSRYQMCLGNSEIKIKEKEEMIDYLKDQLSKQKTERNQDLELQRSHYTRDRDDVQKSLITYKKRCIQLEGKLKRTGNDADIKCGQYETAILKLSQELNKFKDSKNNLTIEVTKLNHFYKNSIFEIAKRKQTLLWVEKFMEYLQTSEEEKKKSLLDINNFVKSEVQNMKTHISTMVTDVIKCQQSISQKSSYIEQEIYKQIKFLNGQLAKVMKENQKFWNEVIKKQRESEKKQQMKTLLDQLEKNKQDHYQQIEELKNLNKIYQNQKKTLILGFQQLRSLNEHRQSNFKEEIKLLKNTIEELIQTGCERDKMFEQQIRLLTAQIQHISQRYYENMDLPAKKLNGRISGQADFLREQLSKIQQNSTIRNLQNLLQQFMKNKDSTQDRKLRNQIQDYIQHCTIILQTLTDLIKCNNSPIKQNKKIEQSMQIDREIEKIQNREKLNKITYEASLAKKHLAKLQEHCHQLEKKGNHSQGKDNFKQGRKVIQLQAQREALLQNIELLKSSHQQDINSLKRTLQILSSQSESTTKTSKLLSSTIMKLNQINSRLVQCMTRQQESFSYIKGNMDVISKILNIPIQSFESLSKQMRDISEYSRDQTFRFDNMNTNNIQKPSFPFNNDLIKAYKQVFQKRSQNGNAIQRHITQLIKTIRETQQKNIQKKKLSQGTQQKQNEIKTKNHAHSQRGIEKKLKQMQNQRVKEHQGYCGRLQQMEINIQSLSKKLTKSNSLRTVLEKLEDNLNIKIEEIINKMQTKLDRSDVQGLKDQVINDLRSKLSESNAECQGLRKQMTIQYTARRQ